MANVLKLQSLSKSDQKKDIYSITQLFDKK